MTVHTTPNAEMRRYPGETLAVWRTSMAAGATGPRHTIDREHAVVVLAGELHAEVDGAVQVVPAGEAIAIPAGAERQLANRGSSPLVTLTAALPGSIARVGDGDPVAVPWAS